MAGRILIDHRIMGGVPCIAGTRIPVATIVGLIAQGETSSTIIAEFPQLEPRDITAALTYASINS